MIQKSFKVCGISNHLNRSEYSQIRKDLPQEDLLNSDNEEFEFDGFEALDIPDSLKELNSE